MARRDESSPLVIFAAMLVTSLVLHLLLWPLGNRLILLSWDAAPLPPSSGWLQVALVDPDESEPPEPEVTTEPPPEPAGKLIKQDRVKKESIPDEAKYLAEFDQKVDRETRAARGRSNAGGAPTQPGDSPDANNKPDIAKLLPPRPADPAAGSESQADDGRGDPMLPKVPNPRALLPLRPDLAGGGQPGVRGNPSQSQADPGDHGSMDDIQDVDGGDATSLNSRRWKYASFFNRVRDQVAQHWHPEVVHAARDPTGSRYGFKTRTTRLLIRLNPDGSLKAIKLDQAAGLDFLDEEAIRAVRAAQPFPNPPAQLVDPNTGFIDFGFGFIFEVENGGKPRIFRYRR